jgi:hypothetical protein
MHAGRQRTRELILQRSVTVNDHEQVVWLAIAAEHRVDARTQERRALTR